MGETLSTEMCQCSSGQEVYTKPQNTSRPTATEMPYDWLRHIPSHQEATPPPLFFALGRKPVPLEMGRKLQVQYVWIGGTGSDLRCKTKTMPSPVETVEDLPLWNYDGSSTKQAPGSDSEVILRPVKIIPDPFRRLPNLIALCDTLNPSDFSPIETNKRASAEAIFSHPNVDEAKPWYGLEQEYTMFEYDGETPLGWPEGGYPPPQGPYYCSVGAGRAYGRSIVEAHYRACLYAGITISGINAEVMPGQWEFQVGPVEGIDAADQLWLARFLLEKVAEDFNVVVSFDPKPMEGDWNGAGCHTNYSTEPMRHEGGIAVIEEAIERLGEKHELHMEYYGKGNDQRMTGAHETATFDTFSHGVANRGASIRIPNQTVADGKGYFEDRRPAANCDPYDVTSLIAATTILG